MIRMVSGKVSQRVVHTRTYDCDTLDEYKLNKMQMAREGFEKTGGSFIDGKYRAIYKREVIV